MGAAEFSQPEELWQWMAELEKQGMTVIAIPHNSNASKGMMFPSVNGHGKPLTGVRELRNRFEPLIEMMQIKGNSEVHRKLLGRPTSLPTSRMPTRSVTSASAPSRSTARATGCAAA